MNASPLAILVMGVSGCGKSTIGQALADRRHIPFLEGDDFHSAANKAKMAAGIALEDEDRWPWLDALGTALGEATRDKGGAVAACSALKRSYRMRLRDAAKMPLRVVFLDGSEELLAARMRARKHYMPVSLLASQLATLERPEAEEAALTISVDAPAEEIVARADAWIGQL